MFFWPFENWVCFFKQSLPENLRIFYCLLIIDYFNVYFLFFSFSLLPFLLEYAFYIQFVKYYTKLNAENQADSEKISVTRHSFLNSRRTG